MVIRYWETKCKAIIQDKDHEFTERVIKLKGLKTSAAEIIPLTDVSSIIYFFSKKYEIFQIATKSDKAVWVGKLIEMDEEEVVIDFWRRRNIWRWDEF
jgi:hypothetical protein